MARRLLFRRTARIIVLSTLLVAVVGTAFAAGGVLNSDETLYACAQDETGLLRLVDDAAQCRPSEEAVHWNVQGPTGPQGLPGPQGPKGDPGAGFETLDALEGLPCQIEGRGQGTSSLSSSLPVVASGYAALTLFCLTTDGDEPNNTRETATDITGRVAPIGFSVTGATIYPAGDEDWYVVRQIDLTRLTTGAPDIRIDVYRDGELVANVTWSTPYLDNDVGTRDWEFHVVARTPGDTSFAFFTGAKTF